MPNLTLEQFRESFSDAPIDLLEMANTITQHLDPDDPTNHQSPELVEAAQKFLDAERELLDLMDDLDISLG